MPKSQYPPNRTNLGELLREHREVAGWTRGAVLHELEIHETTLVRYEQGEREPSMELLNIMRQLFGLTWEEFLGALK